MEFCKQFNARTQDKAGKVLPVVITYYTDKSLILLLDTTGCNSVIGSQQTKRRFGRTQSKESAEVTWEQVQTIAEEKMTDLNCFTLESAMKMVAGTARSMGITVKGAFPEIIN